MKGSKWISMKWGLIVNILPSNILWIGCRVKVYCSGWFLGRTNSDWVYKTDLVLNLSCLSKWLHDINPALTSNLLTCVIWNLHPLDATKPCSFNRQVISDNDFPCIDSDRNSAIALMLFGLLFALALLVMILCWTACSNLFIKFSDLPSLTPLAFLGLKWLLGPLTERKKDT